MIFAVYPLVAVCKTIVEISGPSTFIMKLEGILTIAMHTANFAPTHAVLFIGSWMRALQIDWEHGRFQYQAVCAPTIARSPRAP